jgi:ankyrin repeat protein
MNPGTNVADVFIDRMANRAIRSKGSDRQACEAMLRLGSISKGTMSRVSEKARYYCEKYLVDARRLRQIHLYIANASRRREAYLEAKDVFERGLVRANLKFLKAVDATGNQDLSRLALEHTDPTDGLHWFMMELEWHTSTEAVRSIIGRVESYLQRGADPNKPIPRSGLLPLTLACAMGYPKLVEMLLDHRADPNLRPRFENPENIHQLSTLYVALANPLAGPPAGAPGGGYLKTIPLGPRFDTTVRDEHAMKEIVRLLLERGSDPTDLSGPGTPHWPYYYDPFRWVLKNNGKYRGEIRDMGIWEDILRMFLRHPKILRDVDRRDGYLRYTPLMEVAVSNDSKERAATAARLLLAAGANPCLKDREGRSILQMVPRNLHRSHSQFKAIIREARDLPKWNRCRPQHADGGRA